jgi:hypothetical protein
LACWFWRRNLTKKNFSVFLLFRYHLPSEKGYPLHLNKLESPTPKDDLRQVWLKLAQWFWRRSQKCKSLQMDRQTDAGQRAITPKILWRILTSFMTVGPDFAVLFKGPPYFIPSYGKQTYMYSITLYPELCALLALRNNNSG